MPTIKNHILDYAQMAAQQDYTKKVREYLAGHYEEPPLACVHSYGCQQNVADGEKLKGLLAQMGYGFTQEVEAADFVIYNTCAVRENAEQRVFGNVGALKQYKKRKPGMIIALAGCMTQQQQVADKLRKSYPYVDIVVGTGSGAELPQLVYEKLYLGKRHIKTAEEAEPGEIIEGLPTQRDGSLKAWVSVMYGCDNFCSYCIVPYVRGRERSRRPQDILDEVQGLVREGYRDITLLGQNVNSYGKGLEEPINFAQLLRRIDAIPGEFRVRFMTSHPKDCTRELIDAMADCPKICNHLHLPVQSGSNRVLGEMNRRYTVEDYLALVEYAKARIPGLSLTSDIIVGFPGESYEEFLQTVALVEQVGYTALYTFIYSRRSGTRAESLEDPVSAQEKSRWFRQLLEVQGRIGEAYMKEQVGKRFRVLPEGQGKNGPGTLTSRTDNNLIVEFAGGEELVGSFVTVEITSAMNWALEGKLLSAD